MKTCSSALTQLSSKYGINICVYYRSEFPRRAAVVNYFADGVCSDSEEPLLSGVPAVAPGHRMEGQFFPLVYDPAWAA